MKKKIMIPIVALLVLGAVWYFSQGESSEKSIQVPVEMGDFSVNVVVKGELDAEKSVNIFGPNLRSIQIYSDIKIEDLIDEGTVVDSGEYIGSLDQTIVLDQLKTLDANLEKLLSQINKSKIDSALELRSIRDQLINQNYALEELEIELQNSKYEPPATQRKIEIQLEKAKRQLAQSEENYELKKDKQINVIQSAIIDYNKMKIKKEKMMDVLSQFKVYAPQPGMLIYARSWSGRKKTPGSSISTWNPLVATLPDLTSMQIKCFVNEIDISKVKTDQPVEITVDAFPDKKLTGKVISVANIGEEMRSSSAHVFEVIIKVDGSDEDLRPSMSTQNTIITNVLDSVIHIPLECLHSQDSLTFVYTDGYKQVIETGVSNEDAIVVTKGLEPNQMIYLSTPENGMDWDVKLLED